MNRIIHVTLWDVRDIFPLANGPRAFVHPYKARVGSRFELWHFKSEDDVLRALAEMRRNWLDCRRACTGVGLAAGHRRECFDPTSNPTCPRCVDLWKILLVFRDMKFERGAA